jgi:hypothetical protein
LLTWQRLRRDGVRPDLLLIEVMPPQFSREDEQQDMSEKGLPAERLSWSDLDLVQRYGGRPWLRAGWVASLLVPVYEHRFALVSRAAPALLPYWQRLPAERRNDSGELVATRPIPTPEQRARALEHARQGYAPVVASLEVGGPGCSALRELLAACRQEGVRAALVLMPEGPAFRSWYSPRSWAQIQEWLTEVSREYDAPLINAREWLDEEAFVDSHHLTPIGAERFSERLGREAIVPLLQGR